MGHEYNSREPYDYACKGLTLGSYWRAIGFFYTQSPSPDKPSSDWTEAQRKTA